MRIPQRQADEYDGRLPALPGPGFEAKQQPADLGEGYDPEAAVVLLDQFLDDPSDDPEADWAAVPVFARAIDEDRGAGRKLIEKYLSE